MAIEHSGISVLRRRGKEGAVVKELVKEAYHAGQRAYIRDGYNVIGTTVFGKMVTYQEVLNSDMDIWHALRAYQDAERKKGRDCYKEHSPDGLNWNDRGYNVNGNGHHTNFFFSFDWRKPVIEVYHCDGSGYEDEEPGPIGQFTNFRWRAGYPKKAQSDHCGGTSCPFEYSCVDGCMYPKGGQNG